MATLKKICIILLLFTSLFVICKLVLENYFSRYDFDSQNILGTSSQDIINTYKKYNPDLDTKTILSLHYSYITVVNEDLKTLCQLLLPNGNNITNKQVFYGYKKNEIFVNKKKCDLYEKAYNDSIKYFLKFPMRDNKYFVLTDDEMKFIRENELVINRIGRNAERFFKEETVKYLTDKNILVSDTSCVSSIDINVARYVQFIQN